MGLIMVLGRVAKNGNSTARCVQRFRGGRDRPRDEAMNLAGAPRLRPILMTAMATIRGMISDCRGNRRRLAMLQPLAIAVIGGLRPEGPYR